MRTIRHVVLDLDGTIYKGGRLFPCTLPFLACLKRLEIGCTFLTNNTSRSAADYVEKLRRLGIEARREQIYTPAQSAIGYVRERLPRAKALAVLGTPSLCGEFEQAGFEVSWERPEAVIVGFDTTLTYERLCRTAWWISRGLPFVATHPDLVCPTDEATVLVDCGSICAALSAATGRRPVVLGKPDPGMLLEICRELHLAPGEVAMAGDRIYTDMEMARRAGVFSVLVLSGEAKEEDAAALSPPPDLVVRHVGEFGEWLERSRNEPA